MKRIATAAFLLVALGMIIPAQRAPAQVSVSVSIGGFYDELSPYGEWIDCSYGECWVPRGVAAGWQPYTNGQWIYTRYGWTWVSDDPWGGDPYHYGTWTFVDRYGWVWVPGTVWAPAWVTWCYGDSYVGWAPMPPTVTFGGSGYSGRAVVLNEAQYVFVPTNRFVGTNVSSVRMEPRRNAEFFRQGRTATRFDVSGGVVRNMALPLATVQRAMGSKIQTREISSARTTARPISSGGGGKGGHVAIVAPASEVKAARASRQGASPHAATQGPPRQQQVKQEQAKQQEQGKQQEQAKQQQKAQKQEQAKQQERGKQQEQAKQQQKAQKQQQAKQQEQGKQQEQAKQQQQQVNQQEQAKRQQQVKQQPARQPETAKQQPARQQEQAKQQARQPEPPKQQPMREPPQQARPQQQQQPKAMPAQGPETARPAGGDQGREKKGPPGGEERPK